VKAWQQQHERMAVRIVPGPARGVAAAVNAGVAALATDVVVRLDGHCRPAADYIARAVAHTARLDVGIVGGVWMIEPGESSRKAEAIAIAAGHRLGSGGAEYRSSTLTELADVNTVPFGCFRRAVWQDLGGLDETLLTNEDYDFNYRARRQGLRVILDPKIRCTYYARPTMRAVARQYGRYGWGKARMLVRHPRAIQWRQVGPALLVPALLLASLGVFLRLGRTWAILLAVYPVAVLIGSAHAAATRGKWPATGWLAGAFFTIHLAWSCAFWLSLACLGLSRGEERT
jgi:GT2 family glycosyltransferase